MAALPIEHPTGSPAGLLAALRANHTELVDREISEFAMAAEWADLHPVESILDAATVEGTEGELAVAGPGAPLVAEFCVAELALAIGKTTDAGRTYLGDALEVRHRLPRLWVRVMAAEVPVWKARRIAQATRSLPFDAAGYVDQHLAAVAHRVGFAQIDRTVDAARALFDPAAADQRRREAAERRHLTIDTTQVTTEGTMRIHGELDLADALDLDHALSLGAQQLADAGSTACLDARRAMAAGALARGDLALPLPTEPTAPAPRTKRGLVVYTHLSDSALAGVENTRSQVLVGQVAEWCATATGPVTITPVVDLGVHLEVPGYTPSPRLRAQVIGTHRTCVFPDCRRPARGCDLDHVIPYDQGGPTCSCNLVPLCRFHHRLKTHGGWKLQRIGHRLFVWTSPLGQTHTRHTD